MLRVIATFDSEAFFGASPDGARTLVERVDTEPYLELMFVLESRASAIDVAADLSIAILRLAAEDAVTSLSTSLRLSAANTSSGVAMATVEQPAAMLRIESRWSPRRPKNIVPIRGVLYGRIASPQG